MSHVLITRLDGDGDVLLTGPAVRAVAARAGRVTYLSAPATQPVAQLLPGVDDVVTFEAAWVPATPPPLDPAAVHDLVARLARLELDEAFIFTSFHQSPLPLALLLRMAGVPVIAAVSVDYPGSLLDVRHRVADGVHEVERNLSLVATLGYRLPQGDDARLAIRRRPESRPAGLPEPPYVVVHPGASVPARAWRPERNAELVDRLTARRWPVVVTGSRSEQALCAAVAARGRGVTDLSGRTDHAGLAEVLAGAEVVVVGNTGPAHLAAAVGTPVVSLFAPTVSPTGWHPWKVPHELLGWLDIGCAGCRSRVCPIEGQPCLASVSVDNVLQAVTRLARRTSEAA